jgi:hypothetical protein
MRTRRAALPSEPGRMTSAAPISEAGGEITVEAGRFVCDASCRNRLNGTIAFTAGETAARELIFWGPYVSLPAGVFLISLNGCLDGRLTLEFACDQGNRLIKTTVLDAFSEPVCLILIEPVVDLELRARNTPLLQSLQLAAISISCAYQAAAIPDDPAGGAASSAAGTGRP